MMQTIWKITELERLTNNSGVIRAHWRLELQDAEYSASAYGDQVFQPDPNDENFIPFADLTEEIVLDWVKTALGTERVDALLAALEKQIQEQKTPSVQTGLPW